MAANAKFLIGIVLASSVCLFGDTISLNSSGSMVPFTSSGFSPGQAAPVSGQQSTNAFWNNYSMDAGTGGSHKMNIGYALTGTGEFSSSVLVDDSVAGAYLGSDGKSDPNKFSFALNPAQNYTIQQIDSNSSYNNGYTTFGWYDLVDDLPALHPLWAPLNSSAPGAKQTFTRTLDAGNTDGEFGFYVTSCGYGNSVNTCETYYTDSALNGTTSVANSFNGNSYSKDWNHFALFGLDSHPGNDFVIAFEDIGCPATGPYSCSERMGDYNDLVVEFVDPTFQAPEPATLSLVGFSLLGLGFASHRRFKKK